MPADTEGVSPGPGTSPTPEYRESFVTGDAVYTVRSVDFVPPFAPATGSLFDDPEADIDKTWRAAVAMSREISAASREQVETRLEKARDIIRQLANAPREDPERANG